MPCWNIRKSQGKLDERIFSDLLDGLLNGQAKPLLDKQRSKRQPHWLCRGASRGVELRHMLLTALLMASESRRAPSGPSPAYRQKALRTHRLGLAVMVYSVHLRCSEVAVIANRLDCAKFIGSRSLKQLAQQSILLAQESLAPDISIQNNALNYRRKIRSVSIKIPIYICGQTQILPLESCVDKI